MNMGLRFEDHEQFHRAAAAMTGAGTAAGIAAALASGVGTPLVRTLVIGCAVVGAAAWARRDRRFSFLASLAAVAAGVLAMAFASEPVAGLVAFALCAGVAVVGFDQAGTRRRVWGMFALGSAATLIAVGVLERVATADQLAGLPPVAITALGGAAFGLIAVAGRLPLHVGWRADRVGAAYAALGPVDDEVGSLATRARDLWQTLATSLDDRDDNRAAMEDAVLRVLHVAAGWRKAEAGATATRVSDLEAQAKSLEERLEATEDAVARQQYRSALDAIGEQMRYLRDIGLKRERVVARLYNYLATMEQLRLAVANARSTEASEPAAELAAVLEELDQMGHDMVVETPAQDPE